MSLKWQTQSMDDVDILIVMLFSGPYDVTLIILMRALQQTLSVSVKILT